MVSAAGTLYAFVEDGAFYSLTDDQWLRERDLPRRARPAELAGADGAVYALVNATLAGELPRFAAGTQPAASQALDPGEAALAVARYDSRGWAAVAACPQLPQSAGATPGRGPRLLATHGGVLLAWTSADGARIECAELDPETGTWHPLDSLPAPSDLRDYWLASVNRERTLVLATRAARGEDLNVRRLVGGAGQGPPPWRAARLQLSELSGGAAAGHYVGALGFNQHVALLLGDGDSQWYLRFGRVDGRPAEPSVPVAGVFEQPHGLGVGRQWVPAVLLLVLFGMMLSLFVFRRGALVAPVALPEGCAVALAMQRLLGCLIDLAPFVLATGALLRVDWQGGLRELLQWGMRWTWGDDGTVSQTPVAATLVWWLVACAAHTLYALVMELLTQRTIGKVLTGTRLLSESGQAPAAPQIIVRNLVRFVELLPPMWVLGFLIVLSRNRQRAGDIFARTVVVRRAKTPKSP